MSTYIARFWNSKPVFCEQLFVSGWEMQKNMNWEWPGVWQQQMENRYTKRNRNRNRNWNRQPNAGSHIGGMVTK